MKSRNRPIIDKFHARNVAETVGEFVSRKAWDDLNWGKVIVHLARLMDAPRPLILELIGGKTAGGGPTSLNPHGDDLRRHRLSLAAMCVVHRRGPSGKSGVAKLERIRDDVLDKCWRLLLGSCTEDSEEASTEEASSMNIMRELSTPIASTFGNSDQKSMISLGAVLLGSTKQQDPSCTSSQHNKQLSLDFALKLAFRQGEGTRGRFPRARSSLVKMLKDPNYTIRHKALVVIRRLGPSVGSRELAETLAQMVQARLPAVQYGGPVSESWSNAAYAMHWSLCRRAVAAFIALGPEVVSRNWVGRMIETLERPLSREIGLIARVVAALGSSEQVTASLNQLMNLIESNDEETQRAAMFAIGSFRSRREVATIIPRVLDMLRRVHRESIVNGLCVVAAIREQIISEEVLELVGLALHHDDRVVRDYAVLAIEAGGPKAATDFVMQQINTRFLHADTSERLGLIKLLQRLGIGCKNNEVAMLLMAELRSPIASIRRASIEALLRIGDKQVIQRAVCKISEMMASYEPSARRHAVSSIARLGSAAANSSAIIAMRQMISEHNKHRRCLALIAFSRLGWRVVDESILATLHSMFEAESLIERFAAVLALRNLGPKSVSDRIRSRVEFMLQSECGCVRELAIAAVGAFDARSLSKSVARHLADLLESSEQMHGTSALNAIVAIARRGLEGHIPSLLVSAHRVFGDSHGAVLFGVLLDHGPSSFQDPKLRAIWCDRRWFPPAGWRSSVVGGENAWMARVECLADGAWFVGEMQ